MNQFDLKSVFNATNRATIHAVAKSAGHYYSCYENGFYLTSTNLELIAIDPKNQNFLMNESMLSKRPIVCIGAHEGKIRTVIATSNESSLLVGDNNGFVIQYSLTGKPGEFEHNYGHLGIRRIFSSDVLGGLVVLGGDDYKVRLLDVSKRERVDLEVVTALQFIGSIAICRVRDSVILAVAGREPMESVYISDLMDLTQLCEEENWNVWRSDEESHSDAEEEQAQAREMLVDKSRGDDSETRITIEQLRARVKFLETQNEIEKKRREENVPKPSLSESRLQSQVAKGEILQRRMQQELRDKDMMTRELRVSGE